MIFWSLLCKKSQSHFFSIPPGVGDQPLVGGDHGGLLWTVVAAPCIDDTWCVDFIGKVSSIMDVLYLLMTRQWFHKALLRLLQFHSKMQKHAWGHWSWFVLIDHYEACFVWDKYAVPKANAGLTSLSLDTDEKVKEKSSTLVFYTLELIKAFLVLRSYYMFPWPHMLLPSPHPWPPFVVFILFFFFYIMYIFLNIIYKWAVIFKNQTAKESLLTLEYKLNM